MNSVLAAAGALTSAATGLAPGLGRDAAREAARRELANPAYHRDDPSLVERALSAVGRLLARLLQVASQSSPGGYLGLLVLLLVLVALATAVRLRVGPLARTGSEATLFLGAPRSAADHRRAADAAAASENWTEAVVERFRAVVRSLEERGLIDPRPGATAAEAAADGGQALPSQAAGLAAAARTFSDVRYGGRAATRSAEQTLRLLDAEISSARAVSTPAAR